MRLTSELSQFTYFQMLKCSSLQQSPAGFPEKVQMLYAVNLTVALFFTPYSAMKQQLFMMQQRFLYCCHNKPLCCHFTLKAGQIITAKQTVLSCIELSQDRVKQVKLNQKAT